MNNPEGLNPDENSDASLNSKELEERISKIAEQIETDENIEKLALILEKEWKKPESDATAANLSYAKFQEKLKASGN